jgi:hypothetical protein
VTRERAIFFALLLAAGAVYGGVALPARRGLAQAEAELLRVKAERQPLQDRLLDRERRRATGELWSKAASPGGEAPVTALRRTLLREVEATAVKDVRLNVSPAGAPLAARARLSAQGSFRDLVTLAQTIAGPRTGLVPDRVRLVLSGALLSLEIDGATLREGR